jgi:hypothetical protein
VPLRVCPALLCSHLPSGDSGNNFDGWAKFWPRTNGTPTRSIPANQDSGTGYLRMTNGTQAEPSTSPPHPPIQSNAPPQSLKIWVRAINSFNQSPSNPTHRTLAFSTPRALIPIQPPNGPAPPLPLPLLPSPACPSSLRTSLQQIDAAAISLRTSSPPPDPPQTPAAKWAGAAAPHLAVASSLPPVRPAAPRPASSPEHPAPSSRSCLWPGACELHAWVRPKADGEVSLA